MMVVLFNDKEDFQDYAERLSPALASAEGFWHPVTNVSYFFDYGSSEQFKILKKFMDDSRKGSRPNAMKPAIATPSTM